ncbi:Taurine catabolism dioxygenase TauD%2C TfdA family [Bordetella ansorpii]|uniref:Taurine catabolism dioxygenase TauD, TfdA family n=1 Tax=Bordetella ansorpii TaxID=288768 RepID=A0A157PN58_9BORD|nr:TauD/TfdA family dioxygenase [Bordetella ansorpii]SAI34750.1 Taurine catabolism dioxygenase TauD%2C TfdA family [Bordetella ansorpii]
MHADIPAQPSPWLARDVENDRSWVLRLTADEIHGIDTALAHAKKTAKPLLDMTPGDFPLSEAARNKLASAVRATQTRWGFCLLKGFPVDRWSEEDTRLAYWGMGLHMGVARPQNRNSDILNDVRDAGGTYRDKGGRGYNTNASLDFHIDFGDVVALLCRRTAKSGGRSLIASSRAIHDEVVRTHPELRDTLLQPFHFSWQGAMGQHDAPYYQCSLAGTRDGHFAFRSNRKNIVAAQRDFSDVPRLSDAQVALLDLLDTLYPDPRFCYAMQLDAGDMQLLNNYVTIHSRTHFEDHELPDRKRHLLRLWLGIPACQPLPAGWGEPYKSTNANTVRGGLRGQAITSAFLDFEARMASHHGMDNHYYEASPR